MVIDTVALLDGLLWLHSRYCSRDDGLRDAVHAMLADYTDDDPADIRCGAFGRYSDGSQVWERYEWDPTSTAAKTASCGSRRTAAPPTAATTSTKPEREVTP